MSTSNINNDEEFAEKLKDYEEVKIDSLIAGHHLRYTKNRYKEEGRTCSYAVVQRVDTKLVQGKTLLWVNSYKEQRYKDWVIDVTNPFKQIRLYKRKERPWTGICSNDGCNSLVSKPYYTCWDCSKK